MTGSPELVVFDLAGTTLRDRGEVPATFAAVLAEEGVEVTPAALHALRGASKRQALRDLLPAGRDGAAEIERVESRFRDELSQRYRRDGVVAIEGAERVFAWLRARSIRVALNTGFDRAITELLLGALGWDLAVVDAIVCGDDVERGRPAPDLIHAAMRATGQARPDRVMNVGDTLRDLQAGHAAGVGWNVGVLSGAHDRATLARGPHSHLLPSVADLPSLFAAAG